MPRFTRADLIAINRGLSSQIESMEDATEEQVAPFKRALRKARDAKYGSLWPRER